jgi:hypothetical protein
MEKIVMLNETIEDARSWVADSIDDTSQWYHSLSGDCLQMLDDFVRLWLNPMD